MSDFNPYRDWLGLAGKEKPTYFELLGIPTTETDSHVIRTQAKRQLQLVLKQKPTPAQLETIGATRWKEEQEALMARIRRAAAWLCDPAHRQQYLHMLSERPSPQTESDRSGVGSRSDPRLRNDHSSHDDDLPEFDLFADEAPDPVPLARPIFHRPVIPPTTTSPTVTAPSTIPPANVTVRSRPTPVEARRRRHASSPLFWGLLLGISVLGVGVVIGMIVANPDFLARWREPTAVNSTTAESSTEKSDTNGNATSSGPPQSSPSPNLVTSTSRQPGPPTTDTSTRTGDDVDDEHSSRTRSDGSSPQVEEESSSEPPQVPAVSAEELDQLNYFLQRAFHALSERDFEAFHGLLTAAQDITKRPADQAMVNRLERLGDYVSQYWQAAQDRLGRIKAGEELVIQGDRMFVVEKSATHLVVRAQGQNIRMDLKSLPPRFEMALAELWFDPLKGSTKVFRGAMMAVHPEFGKAKARREWEEALAAGVELGDLLLVLDDPYHLQP